jgi:hypothetical protein
MVRLSKEQLTILWVLTGLAAAMLLLFTINLYQRDREARKAGFNGYITGRSGAIYLRQDPGSNAPIVTVLELDTPVFVSESVSQNGADWLRVETGTAEGWLPAERVTTDPP